MTVNLRKYTANNNDHDKNTESYRPKKGLDQQNLMIQSFFIIRS